MKLITSFWTVIIISISVAVIFLSFGIFHEYTPKMTQARYDRDLTAQLQTQADLMGRAKKRVQTAITMVQKKSADWNEYVLTRTPPTNVHQGGIDVSVNPYQLSMDTWTFRNNIQRALNAQLKKGGVKLVGSGPLIPTPSDVNNVGDLMSNYYHFPGIKFPVLIFNLGQIQVQGTYSQIMEHVLAYKTMPNYLAMTDGLRFDGTAPLLTGTYNLSVVGFIRGNKVFGTIPEDAAPTSASGFGGGRGMAGGLPGPRGPGGLGAAGAPSGMAGPMGRMGGGR